MQTGAAAGAYLPGPHSRQAAVDAPETFEYNPAAHPVQVVRPLLKPNLPGAHASHGRPSADALWKPGLQGKQKELPVGLAVWLVPPP